MFELLASDIDLLVLFSGSESGSHQRAAACQSLVPRINWLEQTLTQKWLRPKARESPLVSTGAVTQFEFQHGINIAGDVRFLSANVFLDLAAPEAKPVRFPAQLNAPKREVVQLLQKCQAHRKEFLWVKAGGERKVREIREANGFLKELGRALAIFRDHAEPKDRCYDFPSGPQYLMRLLDGNSREEFTSVSGR